MITSVEHLVLIRSWVGSVIVVAVQGSRVCEDTRGIEVFHR